MRFGSNNPVYRKILNSNEYVGVDYEAATYRGVASKTIFYIAMVLIGAFIGIYLLYNDEGLFTQLLGISIFTTFIFGLIAMISPRLSKFFGILYCLGEGMLVGVVSLLFEAEAPGVVFTALLSTIVVLTVVATLFLTNVVKVNGKFTRFLLIFAISMIISTIIISLLGGRLFGEYNYGFNILISSITIFLATLYLFFDLENIRKIVEGRAPKMYEWYVAFGLVFTLIWLYLEILRLVFILANRD